MLYLIIFLKIIGLIFLADVATGFFHFYVDRYALLNRKTFGIVIDGLLIHHDDPLEMLSVSYWDLTKGVYKIGALIFGISLFFGFYWELLFFLLVSAHANVIHQYTHRKDSENPKIIYYLQRLRILQTRKQHLKHHSAKFEGYYCLMTNMANPILEFINFWEIVVKVFGLFGQHPIKRVRNKDTGRLFGD